MHLINAPRDQADAGTVGIEPIAPTAGRPVRAFFAVHTRRRRNRDSGIVAIAIESVAIVIICQAICTPLRVRPVGTRATVAVVAFQ